METLFERKRTRARYVAFGAGALALMAPFLEIGAQTIAPGGGQTGVIEPQFNAPAATRLSAAETAALVERRNQIREQTAALWHRSAAGPVGSVGLAPEATAETSVEAAAEPLDPALLETDDALFPGDPSLLIIGRNNRNTRANVAPAGSVLAEPSAVNNGALVFATGNFNHAEHSTDGGTTWTNVPLPGGPADAPSLCCDQEVVIDDASRVTFHSTMYTNADVTNSVVRIYVRRNINADAANCFYDIDVAGAANDVFQDYPHLGLTQTHVYLSTNNVGNPATGGERARMWRFGRERMAACVATTTETFDQLWSVFGQRVWTPAQGTNNIRSMYWAQHNNATTMRVFRWIDGAAAPTTFDRVLAASTFNNTAINQKVDCRGGANNRNGLGSALHAAIIGFNHKCAAAPGGNTGQGTVGCWWAVRRDAAHTEAHIHAAVFGLPTLALLNQPQIFNNAFCFSIPAVSSNKRGDYGMSLTFGGRRGGGGAAMQGAVGLDDEFTVGLGVFSLMTVAAGTHNPVANANGDNRFGDYFSVRAHEPCEKWFVATNYALLDGTALANVNYRYVEFGRNNSVRCYRSHSGQIPVQ